MGVLGGGRVRARGEGRGGFGVGLSTLFPYLLGKKRGVQREDEGMEWRQWGPWAPSKRDTLSCPS